MLLKRLSATYPYRAYNESFTPGRFLVGMDSGLLILSKLPINRHSHYTYAQAVGDEKFAAKGCLLAECLDHNDQPIVVVTTHLQSGSSPGAAQVRSLLVLRFQISFICLFAFQPNSSLGTGESSRRIYTSS